MQRSHLIDTVRLGLSSSCLMLFNAADQITEILSANGVIYVDPSHTGQPMYGIDHHDYTTTEAVTLMMKVNPSVAELILARTMLVNAYSYENAPENWQGDIVDMAQYHSKGR